MSAPLISRRLSPGPGLGEVRKIIFRIKDKTDLTGGADFEKQATVSIIVSKVQAERGFRTGNSGKLERIRNIRLGSRGVSGGRAWKDLLGQWSIRRGPFQDGLTALDGARQAAGSAAARMALIRAC